MSFCPGDKCPHWGKATKYRRKCYYEPQCWKGYIDILLASHQRKKEAKKA
jgi:hypothetical protein